MEREEIHERNSFLISNQLDIFLPEPFLPGYYIVEQKKFFADEIEHNDNVYSAIYCMSIMALVKEEHMLRFNCDHYKYELLPFSLFHNKEPNSQPSKENLLTYTEHCLEQQKGKFPSLPLYYYAVSKRWDKLVDRKELKNLTKPPLSVIPLKMNVSYPHIDPSEANSAVPRYKKGIYGLLARNILEEKNHRNRIQNFPTYLLTFYRIIGNSAIFPIIKLEDYNTRLKRIGDFAKKWIDEQNITDEDKKLMKSFMTEHGYVRDKRKREKTIFEREKTLHGLLNNFYYSFFNKLIQDLRKDGHIKLCKNCKNIIEEKRRSKFCSDECNRAFYFNFKYYLKHRKEINKKVRKRKLKRKKP